MNELPLKQYQSRALDSFRQFMRRCGNLEDIKQAFYKTTEEAFGFPCEYHAIDGALSEVPYVCLRVPTGGGKTFMACHAIDIATQEYKHADFSLVLWLVPTTPILNQTLDALRDVDHPYRRALDAAFSNVTVKTVEEALNMSLADVSGSTCIILATMQSFRRDNTDGLRVFRSNGALMPFFGSHTTADLDIDENTGKPTISLANVIAMQRPIVIVDEAHNARTLLTFNTLETFKPACIVEFTATPDVKVNPSNMLYSVSAQELKAEEMIKLPIIVEGRSDWHELLQSAINQRNQLEAIAKLEESKTGEYIRPIMLIQAEKESKDKETKHSKWLKNSLTTDFRLNENEVKIVTGSTDEIEKFDLFAKDCEVRYIITQQKLKEGWDCSFAYVLCSIIDSRSKIQVEQILGRILRMPKAKKKNYPQLNQSYAFATSSFTEIAQNLRDALTQNGFDRQEVERMVQQAPTTYSDDLFSFSPVQEDTVLILEPNNDIVLSVSDFESSVEIDTRSNTVTFKTPMTVEDKKTLVKKFPKAKLHIEKAYCESNHINKPGLSPAEQGFDLSVPQLVIQQGDFFDYIEDVLEECSWDINDISTDISKAEYNPENRDIQRGKIDAEEGRISIEFVEKMQQENTLWEFNSVQNWGLSDLVHWLDKRIDHRDITAQEMVAFLSRLILDLQTKRNIPMVQLVVDRYRLKVLVENKIREARVAARKTAFQQFLIPESECRAVVNPEYCFTFGNTYPVNTQYKGVYKFKKHYYDIIGSFDGKDGGEEEQCAMFIDQLNEVEYWVRNLDSREYDSFYLQLYNRKFYPDFVAKLKDGRILVVEHKGADRYSSDDSKEKRMVGDFWAKQSDGKCLFFMTCGKNFEAIKQLL